MGQHLGNLVAKGSKASPKNAPAFWTGARKLGGGRTSRDVFAQVGGGWIGDLQTDINYPI